MRVATGCDSGGDGSYSATRPFVRRKSPSTELTEGSKLFEVDLGTTHRHGAVAEGEANDLGAIAISEHQGTSWHTGVGVLEAASRSLRIKVGSGGSKAIEGTEGCFDEGLARFSETRVLTK